MATHEFTLVDADGQPHDYTVAQHPAGEGDQIVALLLGVASEPIGRMLDSNLPNAIEKMRSGEISLDDDIDPELFRKLGIDFGDLGRDIGQLVASIDAPRFFRGVLRHTTRDKKPLSSDTHYDRAYQANYGELMKAVVRVVTINRFVPFFGTSGSE